jgi:hypothetical protein
VKSRLAELRKGPRPPAAKAAQEATLAWCAGFDRSSNCARISFRLQKLASGARSGRPRVNSPSPPTGSSSSLREQREERKSAGSRLTAAKLWARWRAPSAKAARGALVDGRRLGSGKPLSLMRGRWKRSWRFADAQQWASAGRDRGRQRPDRRPWARLITPRRGGSACARSPSPLYRLNRGGKQVIRPKLERAVKRVSTRGWIAARWSDAAL